MPGGVGLEESLVLAEHLARKTRVRFSEDQMVRLLHDHGFSVHRPKHTLKGKRDEAAYRKALSFDPYLRDAPYTFAHLLMPHNPYVFDEHGRRLAFQDRRALSLSGTDGNRQRFFHDAAGRLAASAQWQATRAGRAGSIRPFPADLVSWDQSDTRWILGLEWLAATLHPERFPGFDLRAEVTAFYRDLYGIAPSAIESLVLPRLADATGTR